MSKKIEINLFSQKSIENAMKEIESYQKSITAKCEQVCQTLAQIGIDTAKANCGKYGSYISFTMKTEQADAGCAAVSLVASCTKMLTSEWRTKDGDTKTAIVNPLLMAEFGAGLKAENPMGVLGVGTGTFPSDTAKEHAFNPEGWYYMDTSGVWHHSSGAKPTMPMYKAWLKMYGEAEKTIKSVFS